MGYFKSQMMKALTKDEALHNRGATEMTEFQAFCCLYLPGYAGFYWKRDIRKRVQSGEFREADLIRLKAMIEVVLQQADNEKRKHE